MKKLNKKLLPFTYELGHAVGLKDGPSDNPIGGSLWITTEIEI